MFNSPIQKIFFKIFGDEMTFDKYMGLIEEKFPTVDWVRIRDIGGWNKVDFVNHMAKMLFVDGDIDSPLAEETRRQLKHLNSEGCHCFDPG